VKVRKNSLTLYEVLEEFSYFISENKFETGRTHQIRFIIRHRKPVLRSCRQTNLWFRHQIKTRVQIFLILCQTSICKTVGFYHPAEKSCDSNYQMMKLLIKK
jgi:hypothetical protein